MNAGILHPLARFLLRLMNGAVGSICLGFAAFLAASDGRPHHIGVLVGVGVWLVFLGLFWPVPQD